MNTPHLAALAAKHAQLDQLICNETQRPLPDPIILASLKKQKLRVKEEIAAQ